MAQGRLNRENLPGLAEETFSGSAGSKNRAYMDLSQHNNLMAQGRLDGSARATTSGRTLATLWPPFREDIVSSHSLKSIEIEALVRYQTQQLQSGIELLRRRHSRVLLSTVEQQAAKRLRVKEMELEIATKKNVQLEEHVRQMAAESQVWFNYAKVTESVLLGLRAKLNHVLADQIAVPAIDVEEGYGDSGSDPFPSADEAEEDWATEKQIQRVCRVCKEREVCVLLLPCRHLCVCKGCESRIERCPICKSPRNASIQVVVN